jgi:hypothetical protein
MVPEHRTWALIGSMSFSPQLCALCGRETAFIQNAEACLLAVFAACNLALKAVGYLRPDRCQAVR